METLFTLNDLTEEVILDLLDNRFNSDHNDFSDVRVYKISDTMKICTFRQIVARLQTGTLSKLKSVVIHKVCEEQLGELLQ